MFKYLPANIKFTTNAGQSFSPRQKMAGNGKRGDDALIAGLLSGMKVHDAAKRANISERTAYRRLADDEFRRKCAATGIAIREHAIAQMNSATTRAVGALTDLLENGPPPIRLAAAKTVLQMAFSADDFDAERQAVSLQPPPVELTPAQRRARIMHLYEEGKKFAAEADEVRSE